MRFFVFFVMLALPFVAVLAHGDGASFVKEVGEYNVDIDYPVKEIISGEPIFFNVRLLDKSTGNPVKITNAEVIIVREGQQIFSANIFKEPEKASGFTYTFPKEGSHEFHVAYFQDKNELTRADFQFEVKQKAGARPTWDFVTKEVGLSVLLALGAGWFLANFIRFAGRKEL